MVKEPGKIRTRKKRTVAVTRVQICNYRALWFSESVLVWC